MRGVHVGVDGDRPRAVHAADRGQPLGAVEFGHLADRRHPAVGAPHPHPGHVFHLGAVLQRIAQEHPDLVTPTLDALDFLAVERLAQLAPELAGADADPGAAGADAGHQFGSAPLPVVPRRGDSRPRTRGEASAAASRPSRSSSMSSPLIRIEMSASSPRMEVRTVTSPPWGSVPVRLRSRSPIPRAVKPARCSAGISSSTT